VEANTGTSATETPADPTEPDQTESEPRWWHAVLSLLVLAAIGYGVFLFFKALEPDQVPEQRNPNFIDTIFASPAVIAAARIVLLSAAVVLLFGALYIAVSVVVRMRRRQWLRRAGPFESHLADEAQDELDAIDPIFELYAEALEENEELARRLSERDEALEEVQGDLELVLEYARQQGLQI
jgi:hypothetical protein